MKIGRALFALFFIAVLTACGGPIVIPANMQVTLPANQNFIISATVPPTAGPSGTPGPSATMAPTATLTPSPTPTFTLTPTSTWTPVPTHTSPYPFSQGTSVIDIGFQPINPNDISQLTTIYTALEATPRHAAVSTDGQKLFISTSSGLFLFNRKGEMLAHWTNIFTAEIPCESCISVNNDGSRFAVITRNAGRWEAQVYDVNGDTATLLMALPVDYTFLGVRNEASIAISSDNTYLAFSAGAVSLRVINMETKLPVFDYKRPVDGIVFTPDGANFIIHGAKELLVYNTKTWDRPANLLMPREDAPYILSPNGKLLAIALPTKMLVYSVETLQITREINVSPISADTREWQIAFADDKTLNGYAIRWDSLHASATVDIGKWDVETGKALHFETLTNTSPDALATLWGMALPLVSNKGDLEPGIQDYNAFRFVSSWMLLVNTPHSACWLKLDTGETTCFKDPDHILFATDGTAYKEVVDQYNTSLQDRGGTNIIQVGTYRFETINRSGEWALINSGKGTNLYTKGKKLPQESVKGRLQGFSENAKLIVIVTLDRENTFYVTVIDKATGNTIFQKKDNFLLKPVLMTADGTVYYLQRDLDKNQTIINVIDPTTHNISELIRISLPAEPEIMTLSSTGLFAIGQKDGSVFVMTQDASKSATFQAATSSVSGLSFNPGGTLLAAAGGEGVRVFALAPMIK